MLVRCAIELASNDLGWITREVEQVHLTLGPGRFMCHFEHVFEIGQAVELGCHGAQLLNEFLCHLRDVFEVVGAGIYQLCTHAIPGSVPFILAN